jgi:two-component system chemotaxis response regulator CheY
MGHRVLIVDDSAVLRKVVARALSVAGLELTAVYQAENGAAALQVLAENQVDLVFADINMPEMSGIEMVERLSRDGMLEKLAVVMVSSVRTTEQIERLQQLGVRGYLTKPFKPEQLREVLAPLLDQETHP